MSESQPATQAASGALAWLWIVGGGALTAALAAVVWSWTVQELRQQRQRCERESKQGEFGLERGEFGLEQGECEQKQGEGGRLARPTQPCDDSPGGATEEQTP
jgi:hypothetical protein